MGPHAVVVDPPGFDESASLGETHQPLLIQALVAKLPVEALDEAVLDRLAGEQLQPKGAHEEDEAVNRMGPLIQLRSMRPATAL